MKYHWLQLTSVINCSKCYLPITEISGPTEQQNCASTGLSFALSSCTSCGHLTSITNGVIAELTKDQIKEFRGSQVYKKLKQVCDNVAEVSGMWG